MYSLFGLLGVFIAGAPFLFNYSDNAFALWGSVLVGVALIGISIREWIEEGKEEWEYWAAALLGVGVLLAPFFLGLSNNANAVLTSILIGFSLSALGAWKGNSFHPRER